ncbi:hypothetical protein [Synechococcus sp. CBW1107]|uniref:hypothetical protein n=1 Tax=Synechococcus sp. CBW1107 TaxID=2789857 RepID=UPI002AD463F7|nr:hypothetical protein [Synechococcus sp. CBW1107]CAK6690789.1 hypothetical protein MNNICLKF_00891 [Synechococcus sp. CBW1107]
MIGHLLIALLAVSSPWWEDYDTRDRFLCGDQGSVVVERNDAQASLISGRSRFTLFRVASSQPGLRFATDGMQLILWGDNLTLEQGRRKLQCTRTDQA